MFLEVARLFDRQRGGRTFLLSPSVRGSAFKDKPRLLFVLPSLSEHSEKSQQLRRH